MSEFDPDDIDQGTALATAPPPPATASALAMQSREVAEIQVKYVMAQRFPRNERLCLDRIVNAFSRPRLAELATYEYAKGGTSITGGSIHAAQAIAQLWGNIEFGFKELSRGTAPDGVPYSEVQAYAHDLESRTHRPVTFIVRHWRDTKKGGYRLKDERDIYELTANMAQRRARGCIFAVIPQDVIDTALEQAETTLRTKADVTPENVAKMLDAFGAYGVTKDHIEAFTQRRLEAMTPAQMMRLKRIYQSVRDEISAPGEWFDMGDTTEAPEVPDKVQAARDAIKAKRTPPPPPAPPPPMAAADFALGIKNAPNKEAAAEMLDASRGIVSPEEADELAGLYHITWVET